MPTFSRPPKAAKTEYRSNMPKPFHKFVKADAGKSPYKDDFFDMTFYSPPSNVKVEL